MKPERCEQPRMHGNTKDVNPLSCPMPIVEHDYYGQTPPQPLTLDDLREHILAVVAYNWQSELRDAIENGTEGHVINHLIALSYFIGDPPHADELADLARADADAETEGKA